MGDANTNFFCLDAATGRELWRTGFEDKVKSSANWYRTAADAPPQILVGSYDFRLYSLDPLTGRTGWSYETGNYINGSPAVSDGFTAFGGCDALIHVVGLADGTKVREVEAGAYIIGSAAIVASSRAPCSYSLRAWVSRGCMSCSGRMAEVVV